MHKMYCYTLSVIKRPPLVSGRSVVLTFLPESRSSPSKSSSSSLGRKKDVPMYYARYTARFEDPWEIHPELQGLGTFTVCVLCFPLSIMKNDLQIYRERWFLSKRGFAIRSFRSRQPHTWSFSSIRDLTYVDLASNQENNEL